MTMQAPATATAPVAAPAPAAPVKSTVEDRAAKVLADLATSEPAVETSGDGEGTDAGSSAADSGAAQVVPEASKAAEDRKARIAEMRAKEAEKKAKRAERDKYREKDSETEKLRVRLQALEPLEGAFASAESLLEMAEQKGMSPEDVIGYLRKRLTDPAAVAKQQAKSEADKLREEMAALKKEMAEREAKEREAQEAAKAQREAEQRAATFIDTVAGEAASFPRSAAFLKRHGKASLVGFANKFIVPLLPDPDNYELSDLHVHMEQFLDEIQLTDATAANGTSHTPPKKNGAEKPVTTLSNAIASERATAVEDVPLHKLSLSERERRLKEKLARA